MDILGSFLSHLSAKQLKKEERIEEKLQTHFEDIDRKVILKIVELSMNLYIVKERLQYSSITPIKENYPFEDDETYICFNTHFPQEAKEWEELNKKALSKSKDIENLFARYKDDSAQYVANEYIKALQNDLKVFSIKLREKTEDIGKYQIGKEFKKLKDCPVCVKF